jgi:PAS domain S-box-containing protein
MNRFQKGNHWYEWILNSLATGIFTVDKDFSITFFNAQAETLTGYSMREALGRKCWTIFRTDHCKKDCNLKKAMETESNLLNVRLKMRNRYDVEIPVAITAAVLHDQEGNIVGGVESFQDERAREALEKKVHQSYRLEDFISKDPLLRQQLERLPIIAKSTKPVLILGETGVGKDVLAKVIHNLSPRRQGPFIKVNCAAIPETMLESELFGYKKGAFTDAKQDKPGKFQLAQNGTIFLDEISELNYDMQAKLLQALEDKEVFPLGATEMEWINARVVAATNRDPNELIETGAFRKDLYYRLKLCEFVIPPLRERITDIPLLLEHFISQTASLSDKVICGLSQRAKRLLMEHHYPGNVREMKNIIEYAVMLSRGTIDVQDLPQYLVRQNMHPRYYLVGSDRAHSLQEGERMTLFKALEANNWHIQNTADNLGINRTTLWRKMKRYKLSDQKGLW